MAPVTIKTSARGWREVSTTAYWTALTTWPTKKIHRAQRLAETGLATGSASSNVRRAQSFTTTSAFSLYSVALSLQKTGAPTDDWTVAIQADSAGVPDGTDLGTAVRASGAIVAEKHWEVFTLSSPLALSNATKYHIVLRRAGDTPDVANYFNWYRANTDVYASHGGRSYSGAWSVEAANDFGFVLFEQTTELYSVVQDTGATPKVRVVKADSATAPTSFTEQDSANNKTITNVDFPFSSWLDNVGQIHAIVFTATNTITHYVFDTDTDQWATGNGNATTVASNIRPIRIVVRSDGDVLIFFTSSADTADLGWTRWEPSAWTVAATGILSASSTNANHFVDAGIDSTDRAWVHYVGHTGASFYKTIDSANTVGGGAQVAGSLPTDQTQHSSGQRNTMYVDGSTDKVVFTSLETGKSINERVATLESDSASGNLTASVSIEATDADIGTRTPISTAVIGGVPYAAWWDDASSGTLKYSTKSGGVWAAETNWKTSITNLIEIVPVESALLGVYQSGSDVVMDHIVSAGTPATMTAGTATAPAAAEAVTLDAASKLTVTTATATAAALASTLTGQGRLAVTPAVAPAAGLGVNLTAASKLTVTPALAPAQGEAVNFATAQAAQMIVGTATAPAAGQNVTLAGQARLAVTVATAPAQGEAVTLDAASRLTVTAATASAQGEAVSLEVSAALAVTPASAPAAAQNVALSGQARLAVVAAAAPAQGEGVTLDAASRMTLSPALSVATGEAVTFDVAGRLIVAPATAPAQGEGVTLDVAARMIVGTALAPADGQGVTLDAASRMVLAAATAAAEGQNVSMYGGAVIPGTLSVAPATAAAAGQGVTFDAAALFGISAATASAQAEGVTLDAAARMTLTAAAATATGETVALVGQARLALDAALSTAAAAGNFIAASSMTLDAAIAAAAAGAVDLTGFVPVVIPPGATIYTIPHGAQVYTVPHGEGEYVIRDRLSVYTIERD
jgi:hypothetical protein